MKNLPFGRERAPRFARALARCPYARLQELLPILFFSYRSDLHTCTVVDLASGTGYLADIFEPVVERVIRVDQSTDMVEASSVKGNVIYTDIRDPSGNLMPLLETGADIVTCLAALHHVCVTVDNQVNPTDSRKEQANAIYNWAQLLAPNGKLILIDVCIPDIPVLHHFSITMKEYFEKNRIRFQNQIFRLDHNFIRWVDYLFLRYDLSQQDQVLNSFEEQSISLYNIYSHQVFPGPQTVEKVIPVDFFNEVVANYSIDGHVAFFPEEKFIKTAFLDAGLRNVFVSCLPTPWIFKSEEEAVWFVRELFALSEEAVDDPFSLSRTSDYTRVKALIDKYLGIYTAVDGTTFVNWQLMYAYGEK
jgi:SAM-dependent methyltransferase